VHATGGDGKSCKYLAWFLVTKLAPTTAFCMQSGPGVVATGSGENGRWAPSPGKPRLVRRGTRSRARRGGAKKRPTRERGGSARDATLHGELAAMARAMVGATRGDEIFRHRGRRRLGALERGARITRAVFPAGASAEVRKTV
jgi:hypothetical protein